MSTTTYISSAFAINMPDITRYARKPGASALGQLICLPICLTLSMSRPGALVDLFRVADLVGP